MDIKYLKQNFLQLLRKNCTFTLHEGKFQDIRTNVRCKDNFGVLKLYQTGITTQINEALLIRRHSPLINKQFIVYLSGMSFVLINSGDTYFCFVYMLNLSLLSNCMFSLFQFRQGYDVYAKNVQLHVFDCFLFMISIMILFRIFWLPPAWTLILVL